MPPRRDPPPQFPIAPVLKALGAENVPDVHRGHRKLLCPFHPDTSPSASVSRYGFNCFSCGRSGDAIKLIREEEGLSFNEAVERCAAITGTDNQGENNGDWRSLSLVE